MFDSPSRVLVIASHPDDDILGCGGTLARLRALGSTVRVVFVGEGISARFDPSDFFGEDYTLASNTRTKAAFDSLHSLSISDIHFGPFHCVRFDTYPLLDIVKFIQSHINDFNPDILFTHSLSEVNIDHRLTLKAVESACRPISSLCPSHILSFEIVCSGSWAFDKSFKPNIFVDISNYWEAKLKAWSFYSNESRPFPYPRSDIGIETLAKYRGMMSGVLYAEAFQSQRSLF